MASAGSDDAGRVAAHYRHGALLAAIENALSALGRTPADLSARDLAPLDEFHVGGPAATARLVECLGLGARDHALDVGCGLGGAARHLAAHRGCRVTGIDPAAEYVATGRVLCRWLGLARRVTLLDGDARELPFPGAAFDGAMMLHAGMNIADKAAVFGEVCRVLRPGARFAVYEIARTAAGALDYPLPWASAAGDSALATPARYRQALAAAGFELLAEENRREFARDALRAANRDAAPAPLGLHTLLGERAFAALANLAAAVEAGVLAPVEFIARKPG